MSILIDNKIPKSLIIDNKTVAKIYINDKLAWGAEEPFPEIDPNGPLTFIKTDAGEGSIQLKNYGTPLYTKTFQINKNDTGWTVYDIENTPVTMNKGDVLQIKSTSNTAISSSTSKYRYFITIGKYLCGGQTASLCNNTKYVQTSYSWYSLFKGTNITTAPTVIAYASYSGYQTFMNCRYLVDASNVISRDYYAAIGKYGCQSMFEGCVALTKPPVLNNPKLNEGYCARMFFGCTSLVNAPELHATTLGDNCYQRMFFGCTSLVNAPELPANVLGNNCYNYMFCNCKSLVTAPELPATTLATSCYAGMFYGCSSLVTAPELPATTLATSCYASMFNGCSSLVTAPKIYAETITNTSSMGYMFQNCTKLKDIYFMGRYVSDTTEITSSISDGWLNSVTDEPSCIFHKNPDWAGPTERGFDTIPSNWQIVDWIQDAA